MHTITGFFTEEIAKLNEMLNVKEYPGLRLADSFRPKAVPEAVPPEVIFWYDVTNVYALIEDCMPYIYKKEFYFHKSDVILPARSLIDTLDKGNFFSRGEKDRDEIVKYILALKELRSCFCHNKPFVTYEAAKVISGIDNNPTVKPLDWTVFPHLGIGGVAFDYNEAWERFSSKTKSVLSIFSAATEEMINAASELREQDMLEWSGSVAAWYLSSGSVLEFALRHYYIDNKKKIVGESTNITVTHNQIKDYYSQLTQKNIKGLAERQDSTLEAQIEKYFYDIVTDIFDSVMPVGPEQILPNFFDQIIRR